MIPETRIGGRLLAAAAVALTLVSFAACDGQRIVDPRIDAPTGLVATYSWELQRWQNGEPVGTPAVELSWELPQGWSGDPFRVYARRGSGAYSLIATVTSCADRICRYTDVNVRHGERYDYYVATADERTGREAESQVAQINVPTYTLPATPTDLKVTGLDAMAFLQWRQSGAQRFRVLLESGSSYFDLGETDGNSFLDDRAENGVEHRYLVAAVDENGHHSRLSAVAIGLPRPDYHAELLWSHEQNPAESGFRFVANPQAEDPVVSGSSTAAQWRVERVNGVLSLRPLGATQMTGGTFTTALSCGPGSEPDCTDVRNANQAGAFGTGAVSAESGYTYVFRVQGSDGRTRYGKVRVLGATRDGSGNTILVFDWAYQLVPDDLRLNVAGGG